MGTARILIAEDEPVISADLESCLRRQGYTIVATPDNGDEAVTQSVVLKPDLVLMDIFLGGGIDGIEAATRLNQAEIPVVFVTSHADQRTLGRARETAPFGYVLKPFEPRALQAAVEIALHRARSEAGHRKVERWLATTLRSIADAVIATDRTSRITFLNPAAELLTGWSQADALGRRLHEVFNVRYEASDQALGNLVSETLAEGDTTRFGETFKLCSRNGESALIEQTIAPVRNDDGEVTGAVVVFRDCTLRKQAEREMRRVQAELERSNETLHRKHEELQGFYHTVSHELKTPLTAAREFVSLVLEGLAGPVTETQVDYLRTAQESCDQMRVSINDLLDSTRLDTGKMNLEVKPGSLGALVGRVVLMLTPAARSKELQLESAFEADLPEIAFDEHRIAQVLNNLINNAIKFTPAGGRIRVTVVRSASSLGFLEVSVQDTGCGIAKPHLERVFERLYQVRGDDVSQGKGLGLGLHICQELVQLHGGKIWARSEPGAGSVFSFALPIV